MIIGNDNKYTSNVYNQNWLDINQTFASIFIRCIFVSIYQIVAVFPTLYTEVYMSIDMT